MTHLLVALSSHGFGHAAQTAPVVNALRQRFPDLRLTLRTRLPRAFLATRFDSEFEWVPQESDFGMVMDTALDVNVAQSAAAYVRLHRDWDHQVQQEARALERLAPDFVLANVPYLILAGAATAAIPACAMCSLNWADIHQHFFRGLPESDSILAQMLDAYRSAGVFLQLEPGMPMANLPNRHAVGSVARLGANRRAEINEKLGLPRDTRLVLIAPGGVDLRLPVESWPRASNIHWLVPAAWQVSCSGTSAMEALGESFTDILHSCDAVIGKPGLASLPKRLATASPCSMYAARTGRKNPIWSPGSGSMGVVWKLIDPHWSGEKSPLRWKNCGASHPGRRLFLLGLIRRSPCLSKNIRDCPPTTRVVSPLPSFPRATPDIYNKIQSAYIDPSLA